MIFNCGSSSQSYKLYQSDSDDGLTVIASGKAYHVGVKSQEEAYLVYKHGTSTQKEVKALPSHCAAAQFILEALQRNQIPIDWIGHRFVHGGTLFAQSTIINDKILQQLESCRSLAPIHNPNTLDVIHLCRELLPKIPQYAAFDTAFHASMPEKAYRYAIPQSLAEQYGFRKFGFHGLSYQYVSQQASQILSKPLEVLKLIACHLGTGGSSVAAINGGHSLDTSMGYSPLSGLVMSTRSGDLDPAILLELIGQQHFSVPQINDLLNKESGLIGISGTSSDLFEIIKSANETGNQQAKLAVEMYVHRLKSYIGDYLAVLGGADAIIFTDDIGVRAWQVREWACDGMAWCGLELDQQANRTASAEQNCVLSTAASRMKVLSIPTDEEAMIALEGMNLLKI